MPNPKFGLPAPFPMALAPVPTYLTPNFTVLGAFFILFDIVDELLFTFEEVLAYLYKSVLSLNFFLLLLLLIF